MSDWVYFISCGPYVKIGITTNPAKRYAGLQTMCPLPLDFEAAVPGYSAEERTLHEHFSSRRHHGEWFTRNDELNAIIAEGRHRYGVPEPPTWVPCYWDRIQALDEEETLENEHLNYIRKNDAHRLWQEISHYERTGQSVPGDLYTRLWRTHALLTGSGLKLTKNSVEQGKYRSAA